MNFTDIRATASARASADAWEYYEGTADPAESARDELAWTGWDLVPRTMTGLDSVDQTTTIAGTTFSSPVMIAATAGHGGADPEAEAATYRAASRLGILMVYSNFATLDVATFAAASDGPWWAQISLMRDRAQSVEYVGRCVAAGASALVLTVDLPGELADAPFRMAVTRGDTVGVRGNLPQPIRIESRIRPDDVTNLAADSGLPVWVKGIMNPVDAATAITAGASGIIVSNHGRRLLPGVAPTAAVLADVIEAVEGRVPVLVDGGIRSGTDVVRALALGATAAGIGRPVLWALAAGGQPLLETVLTQLMVEIRITMAAVGARNLADLRREMIRAAWVAAPFTA